MALFISKCKVILSVIQGLLPRANNRTSYAATANIGRTSYAATANIGGRMVPPEVAVAGPGGGNIKNNKGKAENTDGARLISNPWWGPDPTTGYYRPVDWEKEIDPVFHQRGQPGAH